MNKRRQEDFTMCETSEAGERLFSGDDLASIRADIRCRIIEVFGHQRLSEIVCRLRLNHRQIWPVLKGKEPPSIETLLSIQKVTGASIDWLLTGKGPKFLAETVSFPTPKVIFAADRFVNVEAAAAAGAVL